ncbi:MAG: zinc-ribbon domain-containing protein, partial [Firmicutes bacterium]|nr:zinc-ribbon domain-containing protein [Bacillota bacterium]
AAASGAAFAAGAASAITAPQIMQNPLPSSPADLSGKSPDKLDIDVLQSNYKIPDFTGTETAAPFESKAEKRCPHCGVVNPEKNNFCELCGKEL